MLRRIIAVRGPQTIDNFSAPEINSVRLTLPPKFKVEKKGTSIEEIQQNKDYGLRNLGIDI